MRLEKGERKQGRRGTRKQVTSSSVTLSNAAWGWVCLTSQAEDLTVPIPALTVRWLITSDCSTHYIPAQATRIKGCCLEIKGRSTPGTAADGTRSAGCACFSPSSRRAMVHGWFCETSNISSLCRRHGRAHGFHARH